MLFATTSLARRIERAECTTITDCAAGAANRLGEDRVLVVPLAGGAAVCAESGSPFNKVAGLGFEGVPDSATVDDLERAFGTRQVPVQVELSSLGDPEVAKFFTRRGYELVGFENVLGLSLPEPIELPPAADSAIAIERVDSATDATWRDTVLTGFLEPDTFDGPQSHESFDREALERTYADIVKAGSFNRYLARYNGEIAGGGTLRLFEGVAQLCGAATLKAHRRRGVQSALLRYRLRESAMRGCDVAVVTTQPGSKSQQNAQRFGFGLLYARAILVKQPTA
jgi:ribosomal protein S18 acetylase RimI-like enzyme